MRLIAMEDAAAQEGAAFFEDDGAKNGLQGVQEAARRHHNHDDMDIFDEINQHLIIKMAWTSLMKSISII